MRQIVVAEAFASDRRKTTGDFKKVAHDWEVLPPPNAGFQI
ncbi:MAG: hypothetical protein AAFQ14_17420 [Cyanobacteria bacterium J06621_12]